MGSILPFGRRGTLPSDRFTGFILARLGVITRDQPDDANKLTIDGQQLNGVHGVYQARVTLRDDPTTYRLILAPADAPIQINGIPADEYFGQPLETGR